MSDWLNGRLARHESFDLDAEREKFRKEDNGEDVYPKLTGALSYHLKEAIHTAKMALAELAEVKRRKDALEWAAENTLGESQANTGDSRLPIFEELYTAADVIENELKNGISDEDLRNRLKDGIQEDEMAAGHFIADSERCCGCEEYTDLDDDGNCEDCAAEANSPEVSV